MQCLPMLNKKTLGVPNTPCKWVGEPQYKSYLELLVTCGGGMGGSKWYEYIEESSTDLTQCPGMIYVTTIEGKHIFINTRFVVKAQEVRVMTVNCESDNPYCGGKIKEQWIVPDGVMVKLVPEYMSRQDLIK